MPAGLVKYYINKDASGKSVIEVTCQLKWVQLEAPADFRFEKFSGIRVPLKEQKCNADLQCLAPLIWWLLFYHSCIWDTECETLEYNCNWVKSFQCSLGENSHSMLWNNIKDEWQNTSWIRSYQNYWCRYRHDGDQCLFSVPIQKLSTKICKKKGQDKTWRFSTVYSKNIDVSKTDSCLVCVAQHWLASYHEF